MKRWGSLPGSSIAGQVGGTESSPVQLQDLRGATLLDPTTDAAQAGAFGPALRRYIMSGIYNGDFAAAPILAGPLDWISDQNPLPYWTFTAVSGTSVMARSGNSSANASGRKIVWQMDPGGVNDDAYLEQIVPINGSRGQSFYYEAHAHLVTGPNVNLMSAYIGSQFLKNDASTTTGTYTEQAITLNAIGANSATDIQSDPNAGSMPQDAYYLRVRVGFKRTTEAATSSGTIDLNEVRLVAGSSRILFPDVTNPTTYTYGFLGQNNGVLQLQATSSGGPDLRLDQTNGKIVVGANTSGLMELWGALGMVSTVAAAITANTNDFTDANLHKSVRLRLAPNAAWNLTGIAAGSDGEFHILINGSGANILTLTHQDALSAAANRFICPSGAAVALAKNGMLFLIYDSGGWRVEGKA